MSNEIKIQVSKEILSDIINLYQSYLEHIKELLMKDDTYNMDCNNAIQLLKSKLEGIKISQKDSK